MPAEHVRFAAEALWLEGMLDLPGKGSAPFPAVVVCHPHPRMGGSMHDAVVAIVCRGLLERGIATLRFNFRGTEGSEGEHTGGVGERDDAWAALDYLRGRPEIDRSRLGLAGYSFGAGVAVNCGIAAGVKALAAVSLPPRMIDFTAMQGYDFPVLLVAGDRDDYVPVADLERLAEAIGPQTICTIVRGADHFWGGHDRELSEGVGGFFAEHLGTGA